MTKTDEGYILVTPYEDEVESEPIIEKDLTPKITENVEPEKSEEIIEVNVGEELDEDKAVTKEKPKAKAAPKKEEKPKASSKKKSE